MSEPLPSGPASDTAVTPERRDASPPPADHDTSMTSTLSLDSSTIDPDTSLSQDLDVDEQKHPKGRRKRTTAEDKRILEEAYRTDPKPDKASRRDIVSRVTLNEKEVQIWFQNRRQNDRRKSRPLTAQEIQALRYGGLPLTSSDPITSQDVPSSFEQTVPAAELEPRPATSFALSPPREPQQQDGRSSAPPLQTPPVPAPPMSQPSQDMPSSQESRDGSSAFPNSQSSVGYLANRNLANSWSLPSEEPLKSVPSSGLLINTANVSRFDPTHSLPASGAHPLKLSRSQSHLKLSLSLEGKAVVAQQSPERQGLFSLPPGTALPAPRPNLLRRSCSDVSSFASLPPISSWPGPVAPARTGRGRSRNVHAWESCADPDTRDELTAQAENESNGSAIAEISLLRSTSTTGSSQHSTSKRTAPGGKSARAVKKAKMSRTSSSIARLETSVGNDDDCCGAPETEAERRKEVKAKMDFAVLLSPTDSDKENWSPLGEAPQRRSTQLPTGTKPSQAAKGSGGRKNARILGERGNGVPKLVRAKTAPAAKSRKGRDSGVEIFEDIAGDDTAGGDAEVQKFMAPPEVSPSKRGEMDCAVGLLSLSKGAWR